MELLNLVVVTGLLLILSVHLTGYLLVYPQLQEFFKKKKLRKQIILVLNCHYSDKMFCFTSAMKAGLENIDCDLFKERAIKSVCKLLEENHYYSIREVDPNLSISLIGAWRWFQLDESNFVITPKGIKS